MWDYCGWCERFSFLVLAVEDFYDIKNMFD